MEPQVPDDLATHSQGSANRTEKSSGLQKQVFGQGSQLPENINTFSSANNAEKVDEVEQWAKKVKSAAIYNNYTKVVDGNVKKGNVYFGDDGAAEVLHQIYNSDSRLRYYPDQKKLTAMSVVPLSSSQVENLSSKFDRQDVAICFAYRVEKMDEYGRSGTLSAIALMSKDDVNVFTKAVKDNPQLVYSLVRKLNGGFIKMFDGKPIKIIPGSHVEILSNDRGFDAPPNIKSNPFPAGYNPNPAS